MESVKLVKRSLGAASSKCNLAKLGSDMRDRHNLHTALKRKRDFTGNLNRISVIKSGSMYVCMYVQVESESKIQFLGLIRFTTLIRSNYYDLPHRYREPTYIHTY